MQFLIGIPAHRGRRLCPAMPKTAAPRHRRETAKNSGRFCCYSATTVGEKRGCLRLRPGLSLYFLVLQRKQQKLRGPPKTGWGSQKSRRKLGCCVSLLRI